MAINAWGYTDSPLLSEDENLSLKTYFAQTQSYRDNLDPGTKTYFNALLALAAGEASSAEGGLNFPPPVTPEYALYQQRLADKFETLTEGQKNSLSEEQIRSLTHNPDPALFHVVAGDDATILSRLVDTLIKEGITPDELSDKQLYEIYDRRLIPRSVATGLDNAVDDILKVFENSLVPWVTDVKLLAYRIFLMLIGLDFAWMILKAILRDNYIDGVMRELAQKVLLYGIGWFMVFHGDQLLHYIFKFFVESSETGAGDANEINIGNFFDSSIVAVNDLYTSLLDDGSATGNGAAGFIGGLGKIIMIIGMGFLMAFIVTKIIAAYAEMYITVASTVVLFGFFVSGWTKEIAQRALMHNVAMGFKLFSTLLIARVCMTVFDKWIALSKFGSFTDLLLVTAVIYVCAHLLAKLPTTLGAIVSMTSLFSPGDQIASAIRHSASRVSAETGGYAAGVRATRQAASAAGKPMSIGAAMVSTAGAMAKNALTGVDRETEARGTKGQQVSWARRKDMLGIKEKIAASQGSQWK